MDYQKAYWNLVEHYMALLEKYASLHEKIYGASWEKSIDLKIIGGQNQEAYWNLFDHYMALLERYASLQKKLNRLNPAEA